MKLRSLSTIEKRKCHNVIDEWRYRSIEDPIENPAIAGGIEVEITQESRRTIESIVVPVTFEIRPLLASHQWSRGADAPAGSLRCRIPPTISEVPGGKHRHDLVRYAAPYKASGMARAAVLRDENKVTIPPRHTWFPISSG